MRMLTEITQVLLRALCALALTLCVCQTPPAVAAERLPVFVSILPQQFFAETIGGELVDVSVMVQPGASPATYEPKPRQMARLSEAALYCAVGVPFESAWLERFRAGNPDMRIVDTSQGIEKRPLPRHVHGGHEEEHHDHAEDFDHGVPDPHVWLSPPLAAEMARNMERALAEAAPQHAAAYATNLESLLQEIDALDQEIRTILKDIHPPKNRFMVFHPSWGYFAHEYGLVQTPIEIEGKAPSPAELQEVIAKARSEGIRVVFVQPQFSRKSAELVAQSIDGEVARLDPLAEDWRDNLLHAATSIATALEGK